MLDDFYALIAQLQQQQPPQKLADMQAADTPNRGLYLFFEPNEFCDDGKTLRITRVGTHAVSAGSKSTLWGRLRTHRGGENLGGNHRGSIFRLHVGTALINKNNLNSATWGQGQSAPKEIREKEAPLEEQVSRFMRETMVNWIEVDDAPSKHSDRAYLERNMIALLTSQGNHASPNWLGHHAASPVVQGCGLWNINHVGGEADLYFLDILEKYIKA